MLGQPGSVRRPLAECVAAVARAVRGERRRRPGRGRWSCRSAGVRAVSGRRARVRWGSTGDGGVDVVATPRAVVPLTAIASQDRIAHVLDRVGAHRHDCTRAGGVGARSWLRPAAGRDAQGADAAAPHARGMSLQCGRVLSQVERGRVHAALRRSRAESASLFSHADMNGPLARRTAGERSGVPGQHVPPSTSPSARTASHAPLPSGPGRVTSTPARSRSVRAATASARRRRRRNTARPEHQQASSASNGSERGGGRERPVVGDGARSRQADVCAPTGRGRPRSTAARGAGSPPRPPPVDCRRRPCPRRRRVRRAATDVGHLGQRIGGRGRSRAQLAPEAGVGAVAAVEDCRAWPRCPPSGRSSSRSPGRGSAAAASSRSRPCSPGRRTRCSASTCASVSVMPGLA